MKDKGLVYQKIEGSHMVGYFDSNYADDLNMRRSFTGYVFTLGRGPISYRSMLQGMVALYTTEVEYIAVAEAVKEALWLLGLIGDL